MNKKVETVEFNEIIEDFMDELFILNDFKYDEDILDFLNMVNETILDNTLVYNISFKDTKNDMEVEEALLCWKENYLKDFEDISYMKDELSYEDKKIVIKKYKNDKYYILVKYISSNEDTSFSIDIISLDDTFIASSNFGLDKNNKFHGTNIVYE